MAMNRLQFQKGLSQATFPKPSGTKETCEAAPVHQSLVGGFICALCECADAQNSRRAVVLYRQCRRCRQ